MNTSEYLIHRLFELGITDFFGVPGDYNFDILYAIDNNPETNWIGCTNELNAGYAADGYARKRGYGAVVTTYGVGELSAMNAIAGSFAENIPVVNIVGAPATSCLESKSSVHHTLGNGNPYAFVEAFNPIVSASAFLNRENAKSEIDRMLKTLVKERRPVYIAIPIDVARAEISVEHPDYDWNSDFENLEIVTEKILSKVNNSSNPVILGDMLIKRFDSTDAFRELVKNSGIPTVTFFMGNGILDDDYPNYLGTYFAEYDNLEAKRTLDTTDCLIACGAVYTDLNSFGFKLPYDIESHIAIYGTYTVIEGVKYDNVKMSDVINRIKIRIIPRHSEIKSGWAGYNKIPITGGALTSAYIYPRLQEFLKSGDTLFAETGLVHTGVAKFKLPREAAIEAQALWGSIGWATPASFGACIADKKSRVILLTGEGSHQISAMEVGNMLKHGVKPVVIVLNNHGYSLERLLCNTPNAEFNDVIHINYSKFVRIFEDEVWTTRVLNEDDFDKSLKVAAIMDKLCYIELCTDKEDIPELTRRMVMSMRKSAGINISSIPEEYCSDSENMLNHIDELFNGIDNSQSIFNSVTQENSNQ